MIEPQRHRDKEKTKRMKGQEMLRSRLKVFASLCLCASVANSSFPAEPIRVGVIGLDTSHAPAFIKVLNDPKAEPDRRRLPGRRRLSAGE